MSKLQGFKQPPKFDFKLAKPHSHRALRDLERHKTRVPITGFMHHIFASRRCSASLAPRSYNPYRSENDGLSLDEKSFKPCSTHKRLFSTKFSLKPPSRSPTGGYGKSGQSSKASKRIYQGQVEPGPWNAAKKSKKSVLKPILNSPHRKSISIKSTSSLSSRSRISAGGSKKRGPSTQSPKGSEKNQLEKNSISKPEPDAKSRRSSSVSFHEPAAMDIPACDCKVRKTSSKPDHSSPLTISKQETPTKKDRKEVTPKEHRKEDTPKEHPKEDSPKEHPKEVTKEKSVGCWKTPRIVVPREKHDKEVLRSDIQTKNKEQQPMISSPSMSSIQNSAKSPERDYSEQAPNNNNNNYKSYIPYSRRMESGRSSRSSPDRQHSDNQEKHPTRSSNSCDDDQHKGESNITITFKNCQAGQHVRFVDSDSRGNCGECPTIVELTKQIDELNQKFESVTNSKLAKIYQQLDSLDAKVKSLSDKCSDLKPSAEPNPEHKLVPEPSPACPDPTRKFLSENCYDKKPASPDLTRKSLSTCKFCEGRNLSVLNSFHRQLKKTIGNRCFTDVLMTVFLRADNIYHVNLRDLSSNSSLACFLVTDDGIVEAQQLGFFKEILTFSVIDVRNTLKPKNLALGITFELIDSERQNGGCEIANPGICMTCKPFLARTLGLPLDQLEYLVSNKKSDKNYPEKEIRGFRGFDESH